MICITKRHNNLDKSITTHRVTSRHSRSIACTALLLGALSSAWLIDCRDRQTHSPELTPFSFNRAMRFNDYLFYGNEGKTAIAAADITPNQIHPDRHS